MNVHSPPRTNASADAQAEAAPAGGQPAAWLDRALAVAPVPFAVAVLGGVASTLISLVSLPYPDPGFGQSVVSDAAALYLGQPLYQDPALGYTGFLYTPFLPLLVSVLFGLAFWPGWPVLITILSSLVMLGLVARYAYRPPGPGRGDRAVGVLEALGVGALGWALVTCVQFNGIYAGNGLHDQVAWMPALLGLALVPAVAQGSRAALAAALVGFTVAVWTKQNTVAAGAAAVVWLGLAALLGVGTRRRALGFALALVGLNAVVLGLVNVLTSGWQFFFNFVVPGRHPLGELGDAGFPRNFPRFLNEDLFPATALAIVFAGVLGLGLLWRRRAADGRSGPVAAARQALSVVGREGRRPAVLAVPLLVTGALALRARREGDLTLYFLTAPSERLERLVESVLLPAASLVLIFLVVLALAVVVSRASVAGVRRRGQALGRWARRASEHERVASVLAVSIVVGLPLAFYFRQKKGADDHYHLGIAWALILIGAVAYRASRRHRPTAVAAAVTVLGLFAAMAVVSPSAGSRAVAAVNLPSLTRVGTEQGKREHDQWLTVFFPSYGLFPAERWQPGAGEDLRAYAATHRVWLGDAGELNARGFGEVWPSLDNLYGDVAAGQPQTALVRAWLDRRFDAVALPLPVNEDEELSSYTRRDLEENYYWKLNRMLDARYAPASGLPSGLYARRPGPERAPWMRECFGPFPGLAGTSFRINRGGGFWCRPAGGSVLTLRDTPAPASDVRTVDPVAAVEGTLRGSLPRGTGWFEVALEPEGSPGWRLRGEPAGGGRVRLTVSRPAARVERQVVRTAADGSVTLAMASGGTGTLTPGPRAGQAEVSLPDLREGAVLRLAAARGSRAAFDTAGLRLSPSSEASP